MADFREVAHLLDLTLEVEAVADGIFAGRAYIETGELTSTTGHNAVRMVKFKSGN